MNRKQDGKIYVETAVALGASGTFHYEVPAHLAPLLKVGVGLIVPFGNRRVTAFVVAYPSEPPKDVRGILPVEGLVSADPFFDPARLDLYRFMSRYYLAPLGEVMRTVMPPGALAATKRYACATEAGRAAFRTGGLDAKTKDVLRELLSRPDGLLHSTLRRRVPAVGEQALRTMESRGWIRTEARLKESGIRKKTVDHFLAADEALAAEALRKMRRAKKRQAALSCLLDAGRPLSKEEVAGAIGGDPNAFLRDLERDGLIQRVAVEVFENRTFEPDAAPAKLMPEQAKAVDAVEPSIARSEFRPFLLHGVTGSGKTEVYLRLVDLALKKSKTALVLAPEIALTPLLLGRFAGRFGSAAAASHSGISAAERRDLWRRIQAGQVRVVVGARSALFAPLENLGVIVVDEEHDSSYKQDDGVPYNARDLAVYLARAASCPVVLGSATPSCESYQAALDGRYALLNLTKRIHSRKLPPVNVVDLRPIVAEARRQRKKKNAEDELPHVRLLFSEPMKKALRETFEAGDQSILLLNRRGYSTHLFCLACGSPVTCPNCDVTLKFHLSRQKVVCHHCDHEADPPKTCVICGSGHLFYSGAGTEQVEHELRKILPDARVVRMDRDTVTERDGHEKILSAFGRGEFDILLGTQMVAKGHDFPNVTLVGVLSADTTLSIPDFRSAERTFQLLAQVAGRAGRDDKPGRIVVQTFNPRHYTVECAARHDFRGFFDIEIEKRKRGFYPPYVRLALVRISALDETVARKTAMAAARTLTAAAKKAGLAPECIIGPAKSPLSQLRGRYRYQILVKAADPNVLRFIAQSCFQATPGASAEIAVDIDPQNVL